MGFDSSMEKINRISSQIDDYIRCFGCARLGVYLLQDIGGRQMLSHFLNSLMTALRRAQLRPVYSWSFDSAANRYTIVLLVSGYFRKDLDDVTEVFHRLLRLYSNSYAPRIADMQISAETIQQDKNALWNILQNTFFVSFPSGQINPWHQRQFACCRVC